MVFAVQLADGARSIDQCPELSPAQRSALEKYFEPFAKYLGE
jgi:hypothetical protein